jgi:hypothetical protein
MDVKDIIFSTLGLRKKLVHITILGLFFALSAMHAQEHETWCLSYKEFHDCYWSRVWKTAEDQHYVLTLGGSYYSEDECNNGVMLIMQQCVSTTDCSMRVEIISPCYPCCGTQVNYIFQNGRWVKVSDGNKNSGNSSSNNGAANSGNRKTDKNGASPDSPTAGAVPVPKEPSDIEKAGHVVAGALPGILSAIDKYNADKSRKPTQEQAGIPEGYSDKDGANDDWNIREKETASAPDISIAINSSLEEKGIHNAEIGKDLSEVEGRKYDIDEDGVPEWVFRREKDGTEYKYEPDEQGKVERTTISNADGSKTIIAYDKSGSNGESTIRVDSYPPDKERSISSNATSNDKSNASSTLSYDEKPIGEDGVADKTTTTPKNAPANTDEKQVASQYSKSNESSTIPTDSHSGAQPKYNEIGAGIEHGAVSNVASKNVSEENVYRSTRESIDNVGDAFAKTDQIERVISAPDAKTLSGFASEGVGLIGTAWSVGTALYTKSKEAAMDAIQDGFHYVANLAGEAGGALGASMFAFNQFAPRVNLWADTWGQVGDELQGSLEGRKPNPNKVIAPLMNDFGDKIGIGYLDSKLNKFRNEGNQ